jgi:hypothetical protein
VRIPEKRLCDLCKQELDLTRPFPTLHYPLDRQDLDLIAPKREAQRGEIFGLSVMRLDLTPSIYQFDLCRGCVDGFLPMIAELKTDYIKRLVAEREKRAATVNRHED